jgi:L-rhamnose mutarotase
MERICFRLKVKPSMMAEYKVRHENVWADMLQALTDTGWRNYSLFLDESDGTLIGYVETDSLKASLAGMAATEVNARWQAEMAPFFESLPTGTPDTGFTQLGQVFYLP